MAPGGGERPTDEASCANPSMPRRARVGERPCLQLVEWRDLGEDRRRRRRRPRRGRVRRRSHRRRRRRGGRERGLRGSGAARLRERRMHGASSKRRARIEPVLQSGRGVRHPYPALGHVLREEPARHARTPVRSVRRARQPDHARLLQSDGLRRLHDDRPDRVHREPGPRTRSRPVPLPGDVHGAGRLRGLRRRWIPGRGEHRLSRERRTPGARTPRRAIWRRVYSLSTMRTPRRARSDSAAARSLS